MSGWLGDYAEDFTAVTCMFSTHQADGQAVAPLTAFESDDVLIYKNGNAAQKTTQNGVTMTSPFDSVTGLHCLTIDTSVDTGDTGFWVAGAVYTLVLKPDTETADGKAVLRVLGQFGIEVMGALRPTTAGRKLDVSAGGEAGIDLANVGSPTTTLNLSGTTIKEVTDVETKLGTPSGASVSADIAALPTANGNADALLDRSNGIETGLTFRNAMRAIAAVLAGKGSGGQTGTETFRNAVADSKNRVISSNDAQGNRSAVTFDFS